MNKKLQVFVSSTYADLKEERQAAVQAILDAGHIPAGMELFKAGNESQLKTIYKWIDESDVYMLILGGRYGSIEEKSGKSYTQLEYEYALSKNIPVFAVVLSESFLTQKITSLGLNNATEQIAPNKYKKFKTLVMSKIIREVDDCKDIKITILSTLNTFLNDYDLVGWIRADSADNIKEFGDYSFEQLNQLLENKTFNSFNILTQCDCKKKYITAKEYFIQNYNYLSNPFKNAKTSLYYVAIYDEIVPFFNELGIIKEDDSAPDPRVRKAFITSIGMKLYSRLVES